MLTKADSSVVLPVGEYNVKFHTSPVGGSG